MIAIQAFDAGKIEDFTFEDAVKRARTALWSEGRSVILIIDGREHEFHFRTSLPEAKALALLKENEVTIVREDGARIFVFLTASVCLLAVIYLFLTS